MSKDIPSRVADDKKKERAPRLIDTPEKMGGIWPALIEAANADEKLAVRALANPVLALEELGYSLTPEYRSHVEAVVRFPPETIKDMASLKERINRLAGRPVDVDSPAELDRFLFKELKLPALRRAPQAQGATSKAPLRLHTAALPFRTRWAAKAEDPLEELIGAHPVMEPLLAYRQLEASRPHLATPELYQKIKQGEVKVPLKNVRFRVRGTPK